MESIYSVYTHILVEAGQGCTRVQVEGWGGGSKRWAGDELCWSAGAGDEPEITVASHRLPSSKLHPPLPQDMCKQKKKKKLYCNQAIYMYIAQTHLQLVHICIYQLPTYVCICITRYQSQKCNSHRVPIYLHCIYMWVYSTHTRYFRYRVYASHHPFPNSNNILCVQDRESNLHYWPDIDRW